MLYTILVNAALQDGKMRVQQVSEDEFKLQVGVLGAWITIQRAKIERPKSKLEVVA
ncbi:hypothetical protein [Phyllobacterium myrsinacearum]|uniref:Uncharacterized protein n=1 Tax=Phyllobacterium myrsinacearum TaxID=28101 RepID=A0A839EZ47_9HYPH|nr:hypothetical protein [Phyllobacterium myrsinacearum]MBA8881657.1 hypothetical protein [Phyllobacterium myrsinacearum]